MSFDVGQKVECIHDTNFTHMIRRGTIYEVEYVYFPRGHTAICLKGVGTWYPDAPPGWPATWFRPIIERKTDISIFTAMLTDRVNESAL